MPNGTRLEGTPAAERWPSMFGTGAWRGTRESFDVSDAETTRLVVVWRCQHRHRTEREAELCAKTGGRVSGRHKRGF